MISVLEGVCLTALALCGHNVFVSYEFGPHAVRVQVHHVNVLVGHGHAAGRPLGRTLALVRDVKVEQDDVAAGVGQGQSARAVAVIDVGASGTDDVSLQGHGEAPQAALAAPGWAVGTGPGGPLASPRLVAPAHRLKGLEQQEGAVLAGPCTMQEWRQVGRVKGQVVTSSNLF